MKNTFWVNLTGKGYPLPYHRFRWCQDKLKIRPIKRVLSELKKKEQMVVFVGLRKEESSDRARSLKKRVETDFKLSDSTEFPTYAPLIDIKEREIWEFLINHNPPYGGSYKRVIELYKEARGECPLMPSQVKDFKSGCGMRFGCWVCTLVREDKTLKNQIKEYLDLKPFYEFREFMIRLCSSPESRSGIRRNGKFIGEGKGVLKISVRKRLLEELLKLQSKIGNKLISNSELKLIRTIWEKDKKKFGEMIK